MKDDSTLESCLTDYWSFIFIVDTCLILAVYTNISRCVGQ